jgi:hypothetical protein
MQPTHTAATGGRRHQKAELNPSQAVCSSGAPTQPSTPHRSVSAAIIAVLALLLTTFLTPSSARAAEPAVSVTAPDRVEITGEARVGQTLEVDPGPWSPTDVTLTYAWSADDEVLDGQTGDKLLLTPEHLNKIVSVVVTGSLDGETDSSSGRLAEPVAPGLFTQTATPTVQGKAVVDATLTAVPGTWAPTPALSYQWAANGAAIPGATATTFKPAPAQVGKTISVAVTATKLGYESVTTISAETSTVALATLTATPTPTISGTPRVGRVLTATAGTWTPSASLGYQWKADGIDITGAKSSTYTLQASERAKRITVTVTGQRSGYATVARTSAGTAAVDYGLFTATPTPTISGTLRVGQVLTANPGTWSPSASLSYQWKASGIAITGATARTYTLKAADRTKKLTVTVTGRRSGFVTVAKSSAATGAVDYGRFSSTAAPTITGTLRVGRVLTANAGTWSPAASFSYQWKANGVAITGATGRTYTLKAADRTKRLTVTVTGRRSGFITVSRTSAATSAVGYGLFSSAPTPKISGTAQVGSTLKVTPGTWSPAATLSYRWKANGVVITGATGTSYVVKSTDYGKTITVTVTARRSGFTTTSRTSAPTVKVTKPFASTYAPVITGTKRVGSTLKATTRAWSPTATFTYQWRRNGTAIAGATGTSYRLASADHGKTITVTVTGRRSGYTTKSRTSAQTTTILAPAPTLTADGMYRVGTQIGAGTYIAPGGSLCYWERRSTAGSDIYGVIANGLTDGGQVMVTISSTDAYFVTEGCGSWTKFVGIGTLRSQFADGMYRVGTHIKPGLYTTSGGYYCYWERLSGFSGTFDDLLDNDIPSGSTYVRVYASDVGFTTDDCGTWTRIGD